MRADPRRHPSRPAPGQLLAEHGVVEVIAAAPAVLARVLEAEQTELAHAGEHLVREPAGPLPVACVGPKLLGHERSDLPAQLLVALAEGRDPPPPHSSSHSTSPLALAPAPLRVQPLHPPGAPVGPEHRARDLPASLQEVERLAEVHVLHARRAGPRGVQRRLAHQLPEERRAHPLGLGDHRRAVGESQVEAAPEEFEQPGSRLRVGQRKLDGLVHPSGPGRQRRLEQVRAVRGHHEDHVRVLADAVHLVQQAEQQGGRPVAHRLRS